MQYFMIENFSEVGSKASLTMVWHIQIRNYAQQDLIQYNLGLNLSRLQ